MIEIPIGITLLLFGLMALGWSRTMKKLEEVEDKYESLSVYYSGKLMAMYDIKHSKLELDEKLEAYYNLADRMTEDRWK